LFNLSLGFNQLSGSIPDEFYNLTSLYELNLRNNQLNGEISSDIGDFNVSRLYLRNNQFSGNIPQEFCELSLTQYTIGNNKFCPPYPDCITYYDVGYQDTSECGELSNSNYIIEYSLNKPYPNPFNPTTTISFSVPSFDKVSINIYDLNGSLVTTLVDNYYHSGSHIINWDGSNFSSGSYIVKMKSNNFESSQIITLVK